jgi:hypothetical protein
MHWVIQSNLYKEKMYEVVMDTVQRFNLSYSEHKVVPFVGDLEPEAHPASNNVICLGSYSMRHIAKKNAWHPGVFDIYDQDFEIQRSHWGEHMLNFNSSVLRFGDVVFDEDIKFVRPTTDSKVFSGRIFEREEFEQWQVDLANMGPTNGSTLTMDTLVQVSEPLNIFSEYRFWVVKGKVVTSSMYKRGDQVFYSPEVDQRFTDYVNHVISIWSPHETFVIDVADTASGLRIVEPNTLNASGFYAGNMQKLIFALENEYTV